MDKHPKFWYLSWAKYGKIAAELARNIKSSKNRYDLVIGIARGGVPLAMVVGDQINVKIDIINVKSYTGIAKRTKPKILSTLTGIKGLRLLVVDDLVEEGATMHTIIRYLKKMRPGSIATAVLFKRPWSKFHPDFYLTLESRWVVFPWERGDVKRLIKKR